MNLAAIKKFCAGLPGASGEIKWQVDRVYSVGGKMFAIAFADEARRARVSFKVDDDLFLQYTDRPGFIPAPYLARARWVQIIDLKALGDAELKMLLRRSHRLVTMKLTKKRRADLGLA